MRDIVYYLLWLAAGWSVMNVWTLGSDATELQRFHADLEIDILVIGAFLYEKCLVILHQLEKLAPKGE